MAFIMALAALLSPQDGDDTLSALVGILKESDDPSFQLDILKGVRDGLKGRTSVKMPKGWAEVSAKLGKSANAEVRSIVQALSTAFGDVKSLEGQRQVLTDASADPAARKAALETLLGVNDKGLVPLLQGLLGDPALRGAAIRALAAFEDKKTPAAILGAYGSLDLPDKRDAVNTLASRREFALALVAAVRKGTVARGDLTAATIRQLREHKDADLDAWIEKEWGAVRSSPEAKLKEIAEWKAFLAAGPKGDASLGRLIFSKTCMQCHTLFEAGGKVGPELTGANRSDLDYVLSNILDPSAVVGKDYQASTFRLKNERVISGIIRAETNAAWTIMTENDTLIIPKSDIDVMKTNEISMMPEGLLSNMSRDDARDLVAYLQSPFQVPLAAGQEPEKIFNGKDLTDWEGSADVWSVENGEIVGKGQLKSNAFLFHKKEYSDFRLILKVKLVDDKGNSGIQFRSVPIAGGEARGCQADVGPGWWGKLYEESARGLLSDKSGDEAVKKGDWNTYEILAVGSKVRTALNGKLCADLDDPKIAAKGRIAVQVHSDKQHIEVRFKDFEVEVNPKFEMRTVKP